MEGIDPIYRRAAYWLHLWLYVQQLHPEDRCDRVAWCKEEGRYVYYQPRRAYGVRLYRPGTKPARQRPSEPRFIAGTGRKCNGRAISPAERITSMKSTLSLSLPVDLQNRIEELRLLVREKLGQLPNRSDFYAQLLEGALLSLHGAVPPPAPTTRVKEVTPPGRRRNKGGVNLPERSDYGLEPR